MGLCRFVVISSPIKLGSGVLLVGRILFTDLTNLIIRELFLFSYLLEFYLRICAFHYIFKDLFLEQFEFHDKI